MAAPFSMPREADEHKFPDRRIVSAKATSQGGVPYMLCTLECGHEMLIKERQYRKFGGDKFAKCKQCHWERVA